MIRLVASDMDGTLLGRDGRISDRTAQTIRQMRASGCEFVVCTGRGYEDARRPLAEQAIDCDVICMNGAAVCDRTGTPIFKQELSYEQVKTVLACREPGMLFDFMTNEGSVTISTREEFRKGFADGILLPMAGGISFEIIESRFCFIPEEELFCRDLEFFKMSVMSEDGSALERVRQTLRKDPSFAVVSSDETNLEITNSSAQKGIALLKYAESHGIKMKEILAVGDSENDRSMLELPLGYTLAMANGMELAKKTARCQTRSNADDGVAYAIETLVLPS
ncbi:Cof-type HAD-IIB family hydrolase [Brotaphodocola sp.]|uniref:Cof-type HAD-IIB family hydrolase n=1 Tax=Brotaphodocola sp. TaxID=3073577 RepID=UPI003D7DF5FE